MLNTADQFEALQNHKGPPLWWKIYRELFVIAQKKCLDVVHWTQLKKPKLFTKNGFWKNQ